MQQQPNESPPLSLNITTEQIQKYLDENKQLITAILEHQSQGRAAECAVYQNQLQNNLIYLAKIADNQAPPQTSKGSSQTPQQSSMQEEPYVQPSQPAMSQQQQQGFLTPRLSSFPLTEQQQLQQSYMQQQQVLQAQMGMRPSAPTNFYQGMQSGPGTNFMAIQVSRQDGLEGGTGDGLRR